MTTMQETRPAHTGTIFNLQHEPLITWTASDDDQVKAAATLFAKLATRDHGLMTESATTDPGDLGEHVTKFNRDAVAITYVPPMAGG